MGKTSTSTANELKIFLMLVLSSLFTVFIVKVRLDWTGTIYFRFLWLNLFLAWVPFIAAWLAYGASRWRATRWASIPLLLFWLAFFPNALYIVTDLFHIKTRNPIPLWFDVLMLFSAAWNGLLLGYLSLVKVEQVLERYVGKWPAVLLSLGSLFLAGFGVWLGRYRRWNSWDIWHQPEALLRELVGYVLQPGEHLWLYKFTLAMGLFFAVGYLLFYTIYHAQSGRETVRVNG